MTKLEHFIAIERDVTEKVNLEIENKKSQQILIEAQKVSKIGSWEFDLSTYDLIWSKEHYRIFEIEENCPKEELYDLYRSKIHPDDLILLDEIIKSAQEKGIRFSYEHRVIIKNKPLKYVLGIGKIDYYKNGTPARLLGTVQDITERILAEKELLKTKESLEKINKISQIGGWELNLITNELNWTAITK